MISRAGQGGRSNRPVWSDGFVPIIEAFERASGCACRVVMAGQESTVVVHDSLGESDGWQTADGAWDVGDDTVMEVRVGSAGADPEPPLHLLGVSLAKLAGSESEISSLSQELVERHEEVELLASISETLGSVMKLNEAAHHILGDVVRITGASRAGLWIHEPADHRLVLIASAGDVEPTSRELAVDDRESYTARVFASQEPMLVSGDDEVLSVPVTYQPPDESSRRLGVLNLVGREGGDGFTVGERRLLAAIAAQVGAAVEHARLVEESLHRERITAELALAHEMQLKLLPDLAQFQDVADVAGRFEPAESVGGDLYQLVRLSEGRLGVLLGDVSSHGVSAALIMTLTMSAATIVGREGKAPGEVLRRIHRELLRELESTEMYMTIFYGVIDPVRQELCYANAGHPYAFRIGLEGPERLPALDPPLGILGLESYSESRVPWSATDVLLLFTDGLAQCFSEDLLFSDERLAWCASAECTDGASRAVDALYDLHAHADDCPPDDRTALAVRMRGPSVGGSSA